MSIWSSFCTFGAAGQDGTIEDAPYADYTDATDHYTTSDPESLASTPRGGFLDVARSGMCGLFRFSITDPPEELGGNGAEAEVWLDKRQATELRDALTAELERLP